MNSNSKLLERAREARAASHRTDGGVAFLPDPNDPKRRVTVAAMGDGESFGEEFIASATSGEPVEMDAEDEVVEEESGGPFLELDAEEENSSEAIPEPVGLHKLPPRLQ